jgi:uncharacterized damage-inducible protein DinB
VTPTVEYIRELFAYNDWANDRTFRAAAALDAALLDCNLGNSFGSLRNTLAHIVGAEWVWLERWNGRSPASLPSGENLTGLEIITRTLQEVRSNRQQWFGNLTPERLSEEIVYTNFRGQRYSYALWQQLVHVVNHSTYHRGQITTMLRQLGRPAVSTDLLRFYDERAEQKSATATR